MDFTGLIKSVAPWLGTTIAGPLGGMAIGAIADALGVSDKTKDGIQAALSGATPEQMLALKNADADFSLKMKELGYADIDKMASLANDDRNSARLREESVKDKTPMVMAYMITFGFFGLLLILVFYPIPEQSQTLLNIMIGALGTAWTSVIFYYFGSSSGSDRKTELLAVAPSIEIN
jgi:hypothetical protein